MKVVFPFKKNWQIIEAAGGGFINDKVPKLAGSLAYYMVFSMGPLLLIIITLCSYFFGRAAVEGRVYLQLQGFVGQDTAAQLQQIIKNASMSGKTVLASALVYIANHWSGATFSIHDFLNQQNIFHKMVQWLGDGIPFPAAQSP